MRTNLKKWIICALLWSFPLAAIHPAHAAEQVQKKQLSNIPMLSNLRQISANQLQVTYDQPADMAKGVDPKNYWIQSTTEGTPTNIATLGMNDSVNNNNSLTAATVAIQQSGNSGRSFILTFKENIRTGMPFKMIICYVTRPGAPPYTGANGSASFTGQ